MTSDVGSPNSAPAAGTDPEVSRIETIDARFAAQDEKIDGLGGKLDQVLAAVTGRGQGQAAASPAGQAEHGPPPGPSIGEQVRAGVAEIMAARQRDEADTAQRAAHDAEHQRLARMERRPAQPGTGRRARLQRWLVGRPDQP